VSQICQYIYNKQNNINPSNNSSEGSKQESTTKSNGDKLVLYYTDWCGISRQFRPIWDQFCQQNNTGVVTVAINCENNVDQCKVQGIRGYPTVILHKSNGQNVEFVQQRTVQNLQNFVNKNKS